MRKLRIKLKICYKEIKKCGSKHEKHIDKAKGLCYIGFPPLETGGFHLQLSVYD